MLSDLWTCWSDWSPCSVSCGVGMRSRTRTCLSIIDDHKSNCRETSVEYEKCEKPSCDCKFTSFRLCYNCNEFFFMVAFNGWSSWSGWSLCNSNGERNRSRKCLRETPDSSECQGNEREVRSCKSFPSNGESRLHIMKNRMS